jgi:hypothetical protein
MRYAKGVMWLDDCRIPFVDETEMEGVCKSDKTKVKDDEIFVGRYNHKRTGGDTKGRFTPNLLVCDDLLNDGSVSKSGVYDNTKGETNGFHATSRDIVGKRKDIGGFSDKGTNSRYYDLDKWFDKVIDEI